MYIDTEPIFPIEDIYINPEYKGKTTQTVTTHKIDYIIAKDGSKNTLTIDVLITFVSTNGDVVIKANLRSVTNFSTTKIKANDQGELEYLLLSFHVAVNTYLKLKLPNHIVQTQEPLIFDYELKHVADNVFLKLEELGFYP